MPEQIHARTNTCPSVAFEGVASIYLDSGTQLDPASVGQRGERGTFGYVKHEEIRLISHVWTSPIPVVHSTQVAFTVLINRLQIGHDLLAGIRLRLEPVLAAIR